nr:hypothetical protein [Tanacetum cinerariifolium]
VGNVERLVKLIEAAVAGEAHRARDVRGDGDEALGFVERYVGVQIAIGDKLTFGVELLEKGTAQLKRKLVRLKGEPGNRQIKLRVVFHS